MLCPLCGADGTRVIDSRPAEGGSAIRRRRECEGCGHRVTTYERPEPQLMVRKRDGRLEAFSSAKLAAGIAAALAERPVSAASIEELVDQVEAVLRAHGAQVTSEEVGRRVLDQLRQVDEVGYLRFASVYKDFQRATDFEKEMATLESAE